MAEIAFGESLLRENLGEKLQQQDDGSFILEPGDDLLAPEFMAGDEVDNHTENLAQYFSDEELLTIGTDLLEMFAEDLQSRQEWFGRYEEGLNVLKMVQSEDEQKRGTRGLTKVRHPLLIEAATDFQARSAPELLPANGPVESFVVGQTSKEREAQAHRVRGFMNYQILEEEPEYYPDYDQMLFHLPFVGSAFKKTWFDDILSRTTSRFIPAEHLVVNYGTSTLMDSERHTEVILMSKNKFNKYIVAGTYQKPVKQVEETNEFAELAKDIEGLAPSVKQDDGDISLLEMHIEFQLPDFDEQGFEDIALPYIITLDYGTSQVVGIRRNWEEFDDLYLKKNHYTHHKFLPGAGFYGYSLYHAIGGLDTAATGALRSLLDAAAYSNLQGGFKLKGRTPAGELEIAPGEFADLDAAVDDVNKAIMALPFKEPSQALFQLLMYLTDTGRQFASITDQKIGESNQEAPVGTTIALIEQGAKVFSGIHKRLHQSQKEEFRIRVRLNSEFLDEEYPYAVRGEDRTVFKADFDDRVDVIPVSDPNIFSSVQRIAQAQATLQMVQQDPDLHDKREAYSRMYDALKIPNYEALLPKPVEGVRLDPVAENMAMWMGKPVVVYPDQNHEAHIIVLDQGFNSLPPPGQQMMMQTYIAHRSAHMAALYRLKFEQALGASLPNPGNLQDPKAPLQAISPEQDAELSAAAAQVANEQGPMEGPPLEPPGGDGADDAENLAKVAEAEAKAIEMKAQAEVQKDQAKTQNQMLLKEQEAQQRMKLREQEAMLNLQIKQIEVQMSAEIKVLETQIKADTDMQRLQIELQAIRERATNDIKIARARAEQQLEAAATQSEVNAFKEMSETKFRIDLKRKVDTNDNETD
jgi:hypothetical protein